MRFCLKNHLRTNYVSTQDIYVTNTVCRFFILILMLILSLLFNLQIISLVCSQKSVCDWWLPYKPSYSAGFCLWCNDSSLEFNDKPVMKKGCQYERSAFEKDPTIYLHNCLYYGHVAKWKGMNVLSLSANNDNFGFCQLFFVCVLFFHNVTIHQRDSAKESGERALFWHCSTAVCGATTDNAPLNGGRKEVDRPLCLKGTRNSTDYETSLLQWGAEAY